MKNDVYNQLLKEAEQVGLTVKKNPDDANILGTATDNLQQCVKVVSKGNDAVVVRSYTNYLSDMGMVISKDWNGSKEHEFKVASDAYEYLITSGLIDDQS